MENEDIIQILSESLQKSMEIQLQDRKRFAIFVDFVFDKISENSNNSRSSLIEELNSLMSRSDLDTHLSIVR